MTFALNGVNTIRTKNQNEKNFLDALVIKTKVLLPLCQTHEVGKTDMQTEP